jgi:uncharacterized cupin superfamily protein
MGLLSMALIASTAFAQPLHPIKIATGSPGVLSTPDVKTQVDNGNVSKNRMLGLSRDKHVKSGLYSSEREKASVDSYPVDEFMYFIKGGVRLTSADGDVTEVKAGDTVYVPKGWRGIWDTAGYTKLYVVYDSEKTVDAE